MDLSGWAPTCFSPELLANIKRFFPDRALFGSDWPVITPERRLSEFEELGMDRELREKILLRNAKEVFGIP